MWNSDFYPPKRGIKKGKGRGGGGGGGHTFTGDTDVFKLTKTKYNGKSKTRILSEVSTSNKLDFLHWRTSIISTGYLKPIIKPFDSG